MKASPNRRRDLVVSDLEGGLETVFLDTATDKVVSLNPTATAIWYLCDGRRTVDDIVNEVSEVQPQIDRTRLKADVSTTLQWLSEHRLLED